MFLALVKEKYKSPKELLESYEKNLCKLPNQLEN